MVRLNVEVDQTQLREILAKLSPQLYSGAVRDVLAEAAKDGREIMESAIDGGTGVAVTSIVAQSSAKKAEIFSMINRRTALQIEEGRKPGDPPTLVQIARWREGSTRRRSLAGYGREEIEQLKSIRDAIRRRGTRGKRFLKITRDRLRKNLGAYMDRIVAEINSNWRR